VRLTMAARERCPAWLGRTRAALRRSRLWPFEYLEKNEIGMGAAAEPWAAPFLRVEPVVWPSGKLGAEWVFASVGTCQTDYSLPTIPMPLHFLAER